MKISRTGDALILLTDVVVEHLAKIRPFGDYIFAWPHHERTLADEFHRIQGEAGIDLPCREKHEHTESGL